MDKQQLPVIDGEKIIDKDNVKQNPTNVFSCNGSYLKTGKCIQEIDCCGGNKRSNAVRIKPRTFGLFAIGLICWVLWNKRYRNPRRSRVAKKN